MHETRKGERLQWAYHRPGTIEERTDKVRERPIDITQSETQREK